MDGQGHPTKRSRSPDDDPPGAPGKAPPRRSRSLFARIALAFVTAVAGAVLVGTGLIGYGATAMNWPRRILAFLAGVALLLPPGGGIPHSTLLNIAGAAVGFPALFWENIAGLQSRGSANRKKKVAEQASDFS